MFSFTTLNFSNLWREWRTVGGLLLFTYVADAAVNHCFKKGYSGPLGLNIAMDFNISATKFGSFSIIEDCSK